MRESPSARRARLIEQRDRLRPRFRSWRTASRSTSNGWRRKSPILADRLDVVRRDQPLSLALRARFASTLASPPADGVGKRLGFLLQELLREANTTGSKANDAAIAAGRDPDQGGARANPRAGGESRVNPFPDHPFGAVGRRKDDDRAPAARAPKRRRLLGVVHDAPAAAGRGRRRRTTTS